MHTLAAEALAKVSARWNARGRATGHAPCLQTRYCPVRGDEVWLDGDVDARLWGALVALECRPEPDPAEAWLRLRHTIVGEAGQRSVFIEIWQGGRLLRSLRFPRTSERGCLRSRARGREQGLCALSPDAAWIERVRLAAKPGTGQVWATPSVPAARQWLALHPAGVVVADTTEGVWTNEAGGEFSPATGNDTGKNYCQRAEVAPSGGRQPG